MNYTRTAFIAIIAVLGAAFAFAYPTVTISTGYTSPDTQTTVLVNEYSGNAYINSDDGYHRDVNSVQLFSRYDSKSRKYIRDPYYCQYDWFDRCRTGERFNDRDEDFWYDRCHRYDPRDDEWYDRNCDEHYGYGNRGRSIYYYDEPVNYRYVSDYSYPRYYVYNVNTVPYSNTFYYQGY